MQSTNLPSKYLVPFAKNDGAKVELPVTTATAGRASQSLGFPPITGQPPEAGGLPPQLEDFNGAMNQPARIAWWSQLGGKFPFDNTFATDTNINGYPNGAELLSSDNTGTWLSLADNNVSNPDTGAGTTWVPARAYGAFALTGQTGGTVTPTPVQAMKRRITIAGTLTSNLIVVLPNWLYSWDVFNNTSGAFTVTVKTAAGAGVVVPQNGAPTVVSGDGTNITQSAQNIAPAIAATQPLQLGQANGRLLRRLVYFNSGGNQVLSVNGAAFSTTGATSFTALAATTALRVRMCGGGGGGGGSGSTGAGVVSVGGGGAAGAFFEAWLTAGFSSPLTITVGAGGAGGAGAAAGSAGGTAALGGLIVCGGGGGGLSQAALAAPYTVAGGTSGAISGTAPFGPGGNAGPGGQGVSFASTVATGGAGGQCALGPGGGAGTSTVTRADGNPAGGFGAGGGGAVNLASQGTASTGGGGGTAIIFIEEYA